MTGSSTKNVFGIVLLSAILLTGCRDRPQIAPLEGVVQLEGQPLAFGSVMMQPVEGGEPSRAKIQSDGTFVMETRGIGRGARVGLNRVRVTCFTGQQEDRPVAADGELVLGDSLIPARYNSFGSSGLTVEVLPEGNERLILELRKK